MSDKRTISVKGIGNATASPDYIVLSLSLRAANKDYVKATVIGAQQLEMLQENVEEAGFSRDNLKTTNFTVEAKYETEERYENNRTVYHKVFVEFECRHELKLAFGMDQDKLRDVVEAIGRCLAQPQISIAFTVKDTAAMRDEVLKTAAEDARKKAQILCDASGVKLGRLININYNWDEIHIDHYLETKMRCGEGMLEAPQYNFTPDDIEAGDTVSFLWEIE